VIPVTPKPATVPDTDTAATDPTTPTPPLTPPTTTALSELFIYYISSFSNQNIRQYILYGFNIKCKNNLYQSLLNSNPGITLLYLSKNKPVSIFILSLYSINNCISFNLTQSLKKEETKMLKFATQEQALQHLSNITGKKIKIASKGKYYITVTEYAITEEHLETIANKLMDDVEIDDHEVYSNDKEGLENLIAELKKKGVSSSDSVKTASVKIAGMWDKFWNRKERKNMSTNIELDSLIKSLKEIQRKKYESERTNIKIDEAWEELSDNKKGFETHDEFIEALKQNNKMDLWEKGQKQFLDLARDKKEIKSLLDAFLQNA
jgi:hypothetical protein